MRGRIHIAALALAIMPALAGCTYDELVRSETMTPNAGNAIAYNSALMIIDPMPPASRSTMIMVPAARGAGDATAATASGGGFDGGMVGATQ